MVKNHSVTHSKNEVDSCYIELSKENHQWGRGRGNFTPFPNLNLQFIYEFLGAVILWFNRNWPELRGEGKRPYWYV